MFHVALRWSSSRAAPTVRLWLRALVFYPDLPILLPKTIENAKINLKQTGILQMLV
jgi:hypothetical protein